MARIHVLRYEDKAGMQGSRSPDPNDIAISLEAARLAFQENVDAIALAAPDLDFLYLVDFLQRHSSIQVLTLFPRLCSPSVAYAFKQKSKVDWFMTGSQEKEETPPKKKMLLHPNGISTIADLHPEEFDNAKVQQEAVDTLRSTLIDLEYLEDQEQPLLPAMCKFAASHALTLTVWPKHLAIAQLLKVLEAPPSWKRNDHHLVFVLPRGKPAATKKWLQVLQQLGYLDEEMNKDLSEAIDVFANMKDNHKALQLLDISIKPDFSVHRKVALVHCALVSPRVVGEWQTAPGDDLARRYLAANGYLRTSSAPRGDVFAALHSFSQQMQLPTTRTYNAAVKELSNWLTAADSSRRRARKILPQNFP
ncbi:unnamed protein product [Cladocopium goreaui]|uniref:Lon protease-like, mitochondrial n=1 Tax=Cladocopium goreaui TaxID=2562237 RepID=A0A9P1C8D3_9DINO|nr:unnamed protein product [Cladocopium goreaui]